MSSDLFALAIGVLFATGTYLILQRRPIRLILGLGLLTHGVNLLIFSTSAANRGAPPIIKDKAGFVGDISPYVDPLPQALVLTAIVISFGITAFIVMLVNRRHTLMNESGSAAVSAIDPFAPLEHYVSGLDRHPDDYEWLGYALDDDVMDDDVVGDDVVGDDVNVEDDTEDSVENDAERILDDE